MAQRIFDTYHASEEEVEGVKNALESKGIDFYETHKGFWGVGSAGIWIKRDHQYDVARQTINNYQKEWSAQVRQNSPESNLNWYALPLAVVIILLVLYLNLHWFF